MSTNINTNPTSTGHLVPAEFTFGNQPIRTITKDDEPWFIANDVCKILDLENARDTIARLESDDRSEVKIYTLGGNQKMNVISEPGLYSLILTSRKPEAKEFKRWVMKDVLPAIRKTGGHSMPGKTNGKEPLAPIMPTDRQAAALEKQAAALTKLYDLILWQPTRVPIVLPDYGRYHVEVTPTETFIEDSRLRTYFLDDYLNAVTKKIEIIESVCKTYRDCGLRDVLEATDSRFRKPLDAATAKGASLTAWFRSIYDPQMAEVAERLAKRRPVIEAARN